MISDGIIHTLDYIGVIRCSFTGSTSQIILYCYKSIKVWENTTKFNANPEMLNHPKIFLATSQHDDDVIYSPSGTKSPTLKNCFVLQQWTSETLHISVHTNLRTQVRAEELPHWSMWWLSGRFGALRWESRRFESLPSHHVRTLGKSLTRSCL